MSLSSSFQSLTGGFFKSRDKAPATPSWKEMLRLCPVRNPNLEWEEQEDRVVLLVKHGNKKSWKLRIAQHFVTVPQDRRVVLDAIGTDVWQMTDGQTTIGHIAKTLAKKYKLSPREAELSLQQFFKELGRRGYIGFTKENDEQ